MNGRLGVKRPKSNSGDTVKSEESVRGSEECGGLVKCGGSGESAYFIWVGVGLSGR